MSGAGSKGTPNSRVLGKAEARKQFLPLVASLAAGGGVVEVTDYGRVAAVIMSYKDYLRLLAQAREPFRPVRQMWGLMTLAGDLEQTSREISESIQQSLDESARQL
jgi:prevent-host-death family protein